MSLYLIVLIIAILAASSIFGIRFYEFHTGKLFISRERRQIIEKKVTDFYKKIILDIIRITHNTKIFLKELPMIIVHVIHFYWRRFSKKVDSFFIKIRHKK